MMYAARQWGVTVKVAFDLHRHELHSKLGLKQVTSYSEEYDQWQKISKFMLYTIIKNDFSFNQFRYKKRRA